MFQLTYKLSTGASALYEFSTKVEMDAFKRGVDSAIMWPGRTHHGVVEVQIAPVTVVRAVEPAVKELPPVMTQEVHSAPPNVSTKVVS